MTVAEVKNITKKLVVPQAINFEEKPKKPTNSNTKKILYTVEYKAPKWNVLLNNNREKSPWQYVRKFEAVEAISPNGDKVFIHEIEQFDTQKAAYNWVNENLNPDSSEELIVPVSAWKRFFYLWGIPSVMQIHS
jgi:hypothetical protein